MNIGNSGITKNSKQLWSMKSKKGSMYNNALKHPHIIYRWANSNVYRVLIWLWVDPMVLEMGSYRPNFKPTINTTF